MRSATGCRSPSWCRPPTRPAWSGTSAPICSDRTGTSTRRCAGSAASPSARIGEALLDQRNLAGIGTFYRAELLFLQGIHPRTPVAAGRPTCGGWCSAASSCCTRTAGAPSSRRPAICGRAARVRLRASRSALPPLRNADPDRGVRPAGPGTAQLLVPALPAVALRQAQGAAHYQPGEIMADCALPTVPAERQDRSRRRHRPGASACHQAAVRTLPVQCRAAPGQESRVSRRGWWPAASSSSSTSPISASRRRSPDPGFLNFRLRSEVLAEAVTDQLADPYAGLNQVSDPQTVVIDYSAPNVAKQMHVGHLRSTVIGDCLHRVLPGDRSPGDPAEPHRRLGHPVRHAGRADPRRGHRPRRP